MAAHRTAHSAGGDGDCGGGKGGQYEKGGALLHGASGALPQAKSSLRLWGGANDLTSSQRMVGILVVMILAMLAFGMFLSGIQALVLIRS